MITLSCGSRLQSTHMGVAFLLVGHWADGCTVNTCDLARASRRYWLVLGHHCLLCGNINQIVNQQVIDQAVNQQGVIATVSDCCGKHSDLEVGSQVAPVRQAWLYHVTLTNFSCPSSASTSLCFSFVYSRTVAPISQLLRRVRRKCFRQGLA